MVNICNGTQTNSGTFIIVDKKIRDMKKCVVRFKIFIIQMLNLYEIKHIQGVKND